MATTITKSIGSGGGRDYSTIAAFVAAIPANLVTADEQWIGELYNDSEFNLGGGTVSISGKTTDATRNIIIRAAAGHSFKDHANKLTNALRYNSANGVAIVSTTNVFEIDNDYVTLEGLQMFSAAGRCILQSSGSDLVVRNFIAESGWSSTSGGCAVSVSARFINGLGINVNGGSAFEGGGTANYHNVTAVQMGAASGFGFRGNYSTPVCTNCAAFGFGTNFRAGVTGNYNASGQASPPGANSVGSLTFADQFQDVAGTSTMDFRVKAGHGLGFGTRDQTYTADLDIVGSARSTSTPTVGAWEFSSGSDTTPPTITGPGGATGSTSSISVAENTTAVFTFSANETVTWSLNGGADVARFSINSSTGALTFNTAPDFESPTDADSNNTYVVGVRATDAASNATTQTCTVTVTDVAIPTAPTIGTTTSISYTTATINWTDNSSNETGFDVEVETPSGAGNWTAASTGASNPTAANATSLAITSLSMGTQYRPRVRARGAEGNSTWSTGSAFTTTAAGVLTLSNIHVKTLGELIGQSGQAGTFRVFADDDLTDEIATKTGTIDGGNDIALSDVLFEVGTWYRVYFLLANGNHGCARVQAA